MRLPDGWAWPRGSLRRTNRLIAGDDGLLRLAGRPVRIRCLLGVGEHGLLYTGAFELSQVAETEEWQAAEEELAHLSDDDDHDGDEHDDQDGDEHEAHDHADHDEDDGYGFASYVYRSDRPFDLNALRRNIFARWPDVAGAVARSKGTLNVAGSDEVLLWNQAGRRISLEVIGRWKQDGERGTQLVLIGRNLDADALSDVLEACTLPTDGTPPQRQSQELGQNARQEIALGEA